MRHLWIVGLALFGMARPMQLVAVTLVYGMGTLIALGLDASFDQQAFITGYIALIPVSASIHYANEYADYETDALTIRTPFSGGSGVLSRTGLSPSIALKGAKYTLSIGVILAAGGLLVGKLSFAAFGVLIFGAFFGWMYSLPPLKLAWRGWGELDNAMLGGIALPTYGYAVQFGSINERIIAICFPFGALVFINLLATTWADREADAQVGKFTLATQLSIFWLRVIYGVGATTAFAALGLLTLEILPMTVGVSGFFVLPVVIWGSFSYTRWHNPFPTVAAMVLMLLVYLVSWSEVASIWSF